MRARTPPLNDAITVDIARGRITANENLASMTGRDPTADARGRSPDHLRIMADIRPAASPADVRECAPHEPALLRGPAAHHPLRPEGAGSAHPKVFANAPSRTPIRVLESS